MNAYTTKTTRRPRLWGAIALLACLGVVTAGCGDVLEVDNPNNVAAEDLLDPAAMDRLANGALFTAQDGYTYMLAVYSTASNELTWIGSRDAWLELELGTPNNPLNEFTDAAFQEFAPARWMADEAIRILRDHEAADVPGVGPNLARSLFYGAINYVTIADWFDDFALSNKDSAGPPLGEAGMGALYDVAIGYLDDALGIEGGEGSDFERNLLAYRARARHSQGVWNLIGTQPIQTGNPLIASQPMVDDALAALAIDDSDWMYMWDYGASTVFSDIGWNITGRLELRFHGDYIIPTGDRTIRDTTAAARGVRLQDPIDGVGDSRLDDFMTPFENQERYADLRIVTAREMYLILAEDALANGRVTGANSFEQYINELRDLDGLGNWSTGSGIAAQDLLIYERRVNLFLQGRRLSDLYRFGLRGTSWESTRPAAASPGTFLPITKVELDANCHINDAFEC